MLGGIIPVRALVLAMRKVIIHVPILPPHITCALMHRPPHHLATAMMTTTTRSVAAGKKTMEAAVLGEGPPAGSHAFPLQAAS